MLHLLFYDSSKHLISLQYDSIYHFFHLVAFRKFTYSVTSFILDLQTPQYTVPVLHTVRKGRVSAWNWSKNSVYVQSIDYTQAYDSVWNSILQQSINSSFFQYLKVWVRTKDFVLSWKEFSFLSLLANKFSFWVGRVRLVASGTWRNLGLPFRDGFDSSH